MDFSTLFKEKRESANLTQDEIAKKLGVSKRTVSSWETGENEPHPKKRRKIDAFFAELQSKPDEPGRPAPGDKKNPLRAFMLALADDYATFRAEQEGGTPEQVEAAVTRIKKDINRKANLILGGLDAWPFEGKDPF